MKPQIIFLLVLLGYSNTAHAQTSSAVALQSEMLSSGHGYVATIKKAYPSWTEAFLEVREGIAFGIIYKEDTKEAILILDCLDLGARDTNIEMQVGGKDVANGLKPELIPLYIKNDPNEVLIAGHGIGDRFTFNYDITELKIRIDGKKNDGLKFSAEAFWDTTAKKWKVKIGK